MFIALLFFILVFYTKIKNIITANQQTGCLVVIDFNCPQIAATKQSALCEKDK